MTINHPAPLSQHLDELRVAILRILLVISGATALAFFFYHPLFEFLLLPLKELNQPLAVFSPAEGLTIVCKTCLWTGVVLSSPVWLFFALQFVLPACSTPVRTLLCRFLPVSFLFLFGGGLFGYFLVIPLTNSYLHHFNQTLGVNFWSLSHYIDYSIILLLANGLAFECCAFFLFLIHYRLLSPDRLCKWRRPACLIIFISSAIITPPDLLSQLLLALPLTVFYEIAILYARCLRREDKSTALALRKSS